MVLFSRSFFNQKTENMAITRIQIFRDANPGSGNPDKYVHFQEITEKEAGYLEGRFIVIPKLNTETWAPAAEKVILQMSGGGTAKALWFDDQFQSAIFEIPLEVKVEDIMKQVEGGLIAQFSLEPKAP
jgi:hypothetical protein